ncbi:hypothetical protein ABER99_21835 [Paenibacillus glucanolyticus]|jgi:peptidoglycan hydrolase CwlO-like protein|uniref:Uncharacterized protein n=1 Tax=Paenibacillus glucanolyticus TaxID=59843 RepID=A0A163GPV6_9BACL|nr:hypothetical protein [Paenibacillus glucanolyticus]KZS45081.1 hypothetical protein AWU65_03625 [Paenibacillus glucanolyticus]OMF65498.1 hypothetical protein BK142_30870 [Paenibacillus glucanolyticus]
MFDKLVILLLLFVGLVYLSNTRSMKVVTLQMISSGEKKVDDIDKESKTIQSQIRWLTNGMVALCFVLLLVGVVTLSDFGRLLFQ